MDEREKIEELLSHYAEGELSAEEQAEAEALLEEDSEAREALALERAVMDKLAALPGEVAPPSLARGVMEQLPPLPGGFLHRTEVSLRRLLKPGLAAASVLAAALFVVSAGAPSDPRGGGAHYPPMRVARLIAGKGAVHLGNRVLAVGEQDRVLRGQRLVVPSGSTATLEIDEGVEVRVEPGSELLLDPRVVHLEAGGV